MASLDATKLRLASALLLAPLLLVPAAAHADDGPLAARAAIDSTDRGARLVTSPSSLESDFAERLQAIWAADPALRRGTTAVYVADAVTGKVLFSVHEDRGMNAASNVKLISTATALPGMLARGTSI